MAIIIVLSEVLRSSESALVIEHVSQGGDVLDHALQPDLSLDERVAEIEVAVPDASVVAVCGMEWDRMRVQVLRLHRTGVALFC